MVLGLGSSSNWLGSYAVEAFMSFLDFVSVSPSRPVRVCLHVWDERGCVHA